MLGLKKISRFLIFYKLKTMKFFILILLLIDLINCLDYRSKILVNQINNELLKHKKSIDKLHSQNRSDFRTNFIKLVENFLMIHLKKLSQANTTVGVPIEKEPKVPTKIEQNKYNINTSKENLMKIIIILSLLSLCLLFFLILSCFFNFRQRSKLNFLNENDFFTYYNSKSIPPLISSSSSFSLQPNKIEALKPEPRISTIQSGIDSGIGLSKYNSIKQLTSINSTIKQNEFLTKEHLNFINGNLVTSKYRSRRGKNLINKRKSFDLDPKLNKNQDSDDEDIVLEHNLTENLPRISLNANNYQPEEIEEPNDGKIMKSFGKINDSIKLDIVELESSNYIRDRYYQILREQVFPYLQKSNISKPINSFNNNDMLY